MSDQSNNDDITNTPTPENANVNAKCVGPSSTNAGKASSCEGCPNQQACASGSAKKQLDQDAANIQRALSENSSISNILLVLSGKGGVGKSTVACQLAQALASRGYNVGLLDVDICGPSAPHMLGVKGRQVHSSGSGWTPVYVNENLSVMSIAFLLPDVDAAVVWRGPRKNGLIKQFLCETDWGEQLDYLIVDTPPGTSDEHISTVQYLSSVKENGKVNVNALVVTTSEEASLADVRKELNFCQKTNLKVIGVVENMSSFQTPLQSLSFAKNGVDCTDEILKLLQSKCPEIMNGEIMAGSVLFTPPKSGGDSARDMAERYNVPYLGCLPLDPNLLKSCDEGLCFVEEFENSSATKAFTDIVDGVIKDLPPADVPMGEE
mmetsp:Transcript_15591/g.24242  ORF Transcript_15591/g.24242 Transcript_15591/m.24242 type:complete len:378 (+) Transcript_15591:60-1193(+)